MDHVEPIVDGVITTLQTYLPARIAAANAAATDFQLDAIAAYLPYGRSQLLTYPAVEVAVPDGTVGAADDGGRGIDMARRTANHNATVVVAVWVQDPSDFERLQRRCVRYGKAVLEVLVGQHGAFGQGRAVVGGVRYAYRANPETRDMKELTAAALLVFSLETTDSLP